MTLRQLYQKNYAQNKIKSTLNKKKRYYEQLYVKAFEKIKKI